MWRGPRARGEGELLAGTIDTWLLWNSRAGRVAMRREAVHATDVTNASRTLLMDLRTCQWDPECAAEIGVPVGGVAGDQGVDEWFRGGPAAGTLAGVPITGVLGEQQSAMFGQGCFEVGDAKNTYGTGLFLLLNTGSEPQVSEHGLLSTVLYQREGEAPVYALEGSVAVGGSLIQWLRDQLGIIRSADEVERIAAE